MLVEYYGKACVKREDDRQLEGGLGSRGNLK